MSPTELEEWYNFVPPKPYQHFKPSAYVDPNGEYLVIHLWGGNIYLKSDKHGVVSGFLSDSSG